MFAHKQPTRYPPPPNNSEKLSKVDISWCILKANTNFVATETRFKSTIDEYSPNSDETCGSKGIFGISNLENATCIRHTYGCYGVSHHFTGD